MASWWDVRLTITLGYWLRGTRRFLAQAPQTETRESIEAQMVTYMEREQAAHGTPWGTIARHMLGLRHGLAGSRRWRQVWSDHRLKHLPAREVMAMAQNDLHEVA